MYLNIKLATIDISAMHKKYATNHAALFELTYNKQIPDADAMLRMRNLRAIITMTGRIIEAKEAGKDTLSIELPSGIHLRNKLQAYFLDEAKAYAEDEAKACTVTVHTSEQ